MTGPRVALITYSTKPRGGVVHTLHLAETLHAAGQPVHVFALGDQGEGFFRRVRVPHTILEAPPPPAPSLDERVFGAVDALAVGLAKAGVGDRSAGGFDIVHAQDCIAARAAVRIRDATGAFPVLRTVHHLYDFTSAALVDCQQRSVLEPDRVLVVSRFWRRLLARDYSVDAAVVTSGVDADRFARPGTVDPGLLRARVGARGGLLLLTVGGIEPHKGSLELVEALASVRASVRPAPVLAVVGGHSFQDYRPYRQRVLARAAALGAEYGRDLAVVGMVPDHELPSWYHAADAFVFPSVKEGWGMAALEAMARRPAGGGQRHPRVPRVPDRRGTALLPRAGDPASLAAALHRICADPRLPQRLAQAGRTAAARYTWPACAAQHTRIYTQMSPGT